MSFGHPANAWLPTVSIDDGRMIVSISSMFLNTELPIDFNELGDVKLTNWMFSLFLKAPIWISSMVVGIMTPLKPGVERRECCEIIVIVLPPNDDGIFATPTNDVDKTKPEPQTNYPIQTWSFQSEISVKTNVPSLELDERKTFLSINFITKNNKW